MFRRFTSLIAACLMAAPFCGCCTAAALPVAETEACPACQSAPAEPVPQTPDCPCCADTLARQLSPETAAAPRLVLVVLQAWVRSHSEFWIVPTNAAPAPVVAPRAPPRSGPAPLYLRHCALLT